MQNTSNDKLDLLWGGREIGEFLNLPSPRHAFRLLEAGRIPSARKVGKIWVASRSQVRSDFGFDDTPEKASA